jgi:hypothetical protein
MTRSPTILLCHKDPEEIIAQAAADGGGDCVAIHFDARQPIADYDRIRAALAEIRGHLRPRRIKCGWGEWSLVGDAGNRGAAAVDAFPGATHFYMLSGDCMPIKTAEYARWLGPRDADYIESFDFLRTLDWIKTGIKEERLIYRHWFNERKHKRLFYASMDCSPAWPGAQGAEDLKIMIGSQWWCLRRARSRRCWTSVAGAAT